MKRTQKRVVRIKRRLTNVNGNFNIKIVATQRKHLTEATMKAIDRDIVAYHGLTKGALIQLGYNIKYNIYLNKILTKKGILVRMGKGKGNATAKACFIPQGFVLATLYLTSPFISPDTISERQIFNKFVSKYPYLTFIYSL